MFETAFWEFSEEAVQKIQEFQHSTGNINKLKSRVRATFQEARCRKANECKPVGRGLSNSQNGQRDSKYLVVKYRIKRTSACIKRLAHFEDVPPVFPIGARPYVLFDVSVMCTHGQISDGRAPILHNLAHFTTL